MEKDEAVKIAKSKKSTADQLKGLLGTSIEVDLLLAMHPKVTAEILVQLSKSIDPAILRKVVVNPATPKDILVSLGSTFPGKLLKNPALGSILIEDKKFPSIFGKAILLKLLGHRDCPEHFGEWVLRSGTAEQQAIYLFNCRRSDSVMRKFMQSKHNQIAVALLENVDCIYESWAKKLGWIPDSPEDLGSDDEPVPTRMQIDYWLETTSEGCDLLYKTLVPKEGAADTVQGELVRAIGRIQGEYYKNGMMNWGDGSGFYEDFKDYLEVWLKSEDSFDPFAKRLIDADILQIVASGELGKAIAEGKSSRSAIFGGNMLLPTSVEISHRRIAALVALWCERHSEPISYGKNKKRRRNPANAKASRDYVTLSAPCPNCGGLIKEATKRFECFGPSGHEDGCGFLISKVALERTFKRSEVEQLLAGKMIGPLEGFHSNRRGVFAATVILRWEEAKKSYVVDFDYGDDQ